MPTLGVFDALGSRFRVDAPPESADRLWPLLEPLLADGKPETTFTPRSIDHLLWDITRWAATRAQEPVVHAAAAVTPGGDHAVLLAGPSGAGKSTLVAALVGRGWRYLTDEAARLVHDTKVAPYPKWLSLDDRSCAVLHIEPHRGGAETQVSPRCFGMVAARPAPIDLIVMPRHRSGADTEVTPLRPAEATMHLLAGMFNGDRLGSDAVTAAVAAVASAPAYLLTFDELAGACKAIEDLLR